MSMETPGMLPNLTTGARLAQFIMGTIKHCYIPNIDALGLLVSEKKIFSFSDCKSMGDICRKSQF